MASLHCEEKRVSNELLIDCKEGVNINDVGARIEKFLNDEEIVKDPELSAKILLPEAHGIEFVTLAFEPRSTKAAVIEVLKTVFAEEQKPSPAVPEEPPAEKPAKPKKEKKSKAEEIPAEDAPAQE